MKTLCTSKEKNDNMQIEELLKKMNLEDVRKLYVKSMNNELLKKYKFPDHPSSDGYYHLYVKDNSKKSGRRQIKSKSIEELQQKVLDYEKHLSNTNLLTFKEMFLLKCEEKIKYCKDNDKKLSRLNTVGKDKQAYNRYIKDTFFESMLITEIRKENIHDLLFLNCKRYDLKKKAFSSLKSIIKMTLDYAFEEELIPENPYYRVNFEKYNNMIIDSIPIEERAHSDNEIMAIINGLHIIQNENPKYMAAFALELQIYMGCRRGEIPPLKWSDIKDDNTIFIHQEQITVVKAGTGKKEYDQIVNHTKTHVNRYFPITNEIKDLLVRLKKVHTDNNIKSDFLFPANTDQGCIRNSRIYYVYNKTCKKCNIPIIPGITKGTHSFRRNAITAVYNQTGNIVGTSKLFGNSPASASQNYYTNMPIQDAKKALECRTYLNSDMSNICRKNK